MKPSLSVILSDAKPGDSEKESLGIGDKLIEAIKAGDGAAVEAALSAFCDSHMADAEMAEDEDEEK